MRIEHVFANFDLAIGSYRRTVSSILPAMTRVAWQIKKQEIRKDAPGTTRKKFLLKELDALKAVDLHVVAEQ
jgi:hypothetical protein